MAASSSSTEQRDGIDVLALIDHFVLGGAETLLARFAIAAPRVGIRLSIACLEELDGNPAAAPLEALGMAPVNLNLVGRPGLRALHAVRRHIGRIRPQVVHTHLGTADLLGTVAARSLGIPALSTVHTTAWSRRYEVVERRLVGACATRVIAVSESARREYLRRGMGREDQVVTIHNGIDVEPSPGAGVEVRRELGLGSDDLVVAMISALRPEKAHDVALDAVESLLPRFPNLRLVIAGQGDLRDQIASRAAKLGGAVVMTGLRPDVMRVLDAADVCLHPSRREALPTTIIEAMAAGVPVVATSTGGIPEIISSPGVGVLVPAPPSSDAVGVALAELLEGPERRHALASAGRQAYEERFTAGPWVQRIRALYDQVLAEHATQRHWRPSRARAISKPQVTGD